MPILPRSLRQFGLRSLLLFCLLVAVASGLWRWHMTWTHKQHELAAKLAETRAVVHWRSWGPEFLHNAFGSFYFSNIHTIQGTYAQIGDAEMELLGQMPTLEEIYIPNTQITDKGLAQLDKLPRVRKLALWKNDLTNEGFRHVSQLPRLEVVDIHGTDINADCLSQLRNHPSLHTFRFRFPVDSLGLVHLATIPNLRLEHLTVDEIAEPSCELLRDQVLVENLRLRKPVAADWSEYLTGHPVIKELTVSNGKLTDQQCQKLLQADCLRSLTLEFVPIGNEGIKDIGRCKNLSELKLYFTNVSTGGFLQHAATRSNFIGVKFHEIVASSSWGAMGRYMWRGKTDLARLHALKHCPQVKFLRMEELGEQPIHFGFLRELEKLEILDIRHVWREIPLQEMAELHAIQEIKLTSCGNINFEGLNVLARLDSLTSLTLSDCQLADDMMSEVGKISSLRSLDISNNPITDQGIEPLVGLEGLQSLNLANCRGLTDKAIESVGKLRNLTSLDASAVPISNQGLIPLHAMPFLTQVNLGNTEVNQQGVDALRKSLPRPSSIRFYQRISFQERSLGSPPAVRGQK